MKKNILVTGAAGFIGSAVASRLIELNYNVYTIDNLSTGFVEKIPNNVKFIKGNTYDKNILQNFSNVNFYAILHIAGQSSGEISFENPVYDLKSNTESTLNLLQFCKNNGCNKFVFASTMSVYGDSKKDYVEENDNLNPKSFYSVGKIASERYLKIYSQFGINSIALRLFNVYGPGQNMTNMKQGMASIFLSQALNDNSIIVKGSLERYRDFVYIDDVVSSFVSALDSNIKGFDVFNVCSKSMTKVSDILKIISKEFPNKIDISLEKGTPGDIFGIVGCNKKILKNLKWKPTCSFNEGMIRMINSLL